MFNRWIISLFVLAAFATTACMHEAKPWKVPHKMYTARPNSIFIGGRDLKKYVKENQNLSRENLIENLKRLGKIDPDKPLTGFASLIFANLEDTIDNILNERNPPSPIADPACIQARKEKERFHLEEQGEIPESFGKIVNYDINKRESENVWTGRIDVCTWIGNNEYYFEMVFYITEDRSLKAIEKVGGTFPDTLNPAEFDGLNLDMWNWKLHAKSGSFGFITARENGTDIPKSDPLFQVHEGDCYDMFFKDYPPQAAEGLPPQLSYCMGRCNDKIINTAD